MTTSTLVKDDYSSPHIRDFGGLADLTADFDLSFHGSIAKLVSIAAVSSPVGGGGGGGQPLPTGGGGGGGVLGTQTPSGTTPTGTTPTGTTPTGGGGGGDGGVLNNTSTGTDPASSGVDPTSSSGGSGGSQGAGASGGGDGQLPFTGYAAMLTAGVGAALAGTGAAVRSVVRRERA